MGKYIFRFCRTCGFYQTQAKTCTLMSYFKGEIEPTDFCSKYCEIPIRCESCNSILLSPFISIDADNKGHYYCNNCLTRINSNA